MTHYEFVYLPGFDRQTYGLLTDEDMQVIEDELNDDPRKGGVIQGTGGVRKMRIALSGRGKSGGGRVLYLYVEIKGRIYLIALYAKNRQSDISSTQKKEIRALVEILKGER